MFELAVGCCVKLQLSFLDNAQSYFSWLSGYLSGVEDCSVDRTQ